MNLRQWSNRKAGLTHFIQKAEPSLSHSLYIHCEYTNAVFEAPELTKILSAKIDEAKAEIAWMEEQEALFFSQLPKRG